MNKKESPLDYLDPKKAKKVTLSNLKPSTEVISLRLPTGLLSDIKLVANNGKAFLDTHCRSAS